MFIHSPFKYAMKDPTLKVRFCVTAGTSSRVKILSEELSKFKWEFAWLWGGSKCLPGWFGALMQWKLKFKWVFACVKEGVKACQDALGHLSPSKRWFDKVAQIGPKIKCPRVPQSAPECLRVPVWVRGGRCKSYLGNTQIGRMIISMGLP